MKEQNIREKIKGAMNHSLTGLPCDPFLDVHVRKRAEETKGETKMKKKLSGGLVFALILTVLLVSVALAVSNWESMKKYFETVRVMDTDGELARWSDEDKIKLLMAMEEAGIIQEQDTRLKAAKDKTLSLKERGEAANAIITERYGADYFDSYTVEQMEMPENERSNEEQARYERWSEEYWEQWNQEPEKLLTEGRVYRETMNNLTEIGEFPRSLLRDVRVSSRWDDENQFYIVTASIDKALYLSSKKTPGQTSLFDPESVGYECGESLCFQFLLNKFGAYLGVLDPNSPEARAKLSLEEAQPIAEKALKVRLNVGSEILKDLPLRANYGESDEYVLEEGRFRAHCYFIWGEEKKPRYMVSVDSQTGRIIYAFDWQESENMLKKEKEWIVKLEELLNDAKVSSNLFNQQGEYIWEWSLEERAAWSKVARPIVQAYLMENPDFAKYLVDLMARRYAQNTCPILIALTQYAYGVPGKNAIPKEKAFEIARQVALNRGALQRNIDDNKNHMFFYDITNPDRPLWKVSISVLFGDSDKEHTYDSKAPWGYFVVMDAHTGEVLKLLERTVNTGMEEIV